MNGTIGWLVNDFENWNEEKKARFFHCSQYLHSHLIMNFDFQWDCVRITVNKKVMDLLEVIESNRIR